ncbi:hypothetical protein LAZ67_23001636, partial [Cordylochernes scorpioides]
MLESAAKASASMLGTASNYRQNQTFTKVCLDHGAMINESCTPIPHSMRSDVDLHAASPVAQNKQGRVQDLALQETKLNEKYNLKYKNYNILRKDRNKEGGGLAFLIKNLYYEDIAINIPNTSDLEAQDYALENTDLNKNPGPDGIHGQMISNLGKNGKEKLLDIFNNSWKTGKLPQDWKTATIIPIKKLDKSADDPKNYQPISLTKHPAYSPDLAPSDYFLFGLLKKELKGKRFVSDEDVQKV